MTTIGLANILGRAVSDVLHREPFSRWLFARSVEHEPKEEIWYEFEGRGVELICDRLDLVQTVFLHRGEGERLAGFAFSMSRCEVLQRLGPAAASGAAVRIPGLGDRGAWDRFVLPQGVLHVQYRTDRDEIDLVTLMRADAVP
jgi:hypothetical protein